MRGHLPGLELRVDRALSPHLAVGASAYWQRVVFPQLVPRDRAPNPPQAFATDPRFAAPPLREALQSGGGLHVLRRLGEDGTLAGSPEAWRDRFPGAPDLEGSSWKARLGVGSLCYPGRAVRVEDRTRLGVRLLHRLDDGWTVRAGWRLTHRPAPPGGFLQREPSLSLELRF